MDSYQIKDNAYTIFWLVIILAIVGLWIANYMQDRRHERNEEAARTEQQNQETTDRDAFYRQHNAVAIETLGDLGDWTIQQQRAINKHAFIGITVNVEDIIQRGPHITLLGDIRNTPFWLKASISSQDAEYILQHKKEYYTQVQIVLDPIVAEAGLQEEEEEDDEIYEYETHYSTVKTLRGRILAVKMPSATNP